MYSAITRAITVSVEPIYLEEHSSPDENHYVWAYHVRIENNGDSTVQLRSRRWRITDANGLTQEVRGPGVVGEQPVLPPGGSFEYTSYCPLKTAVGSMHGSYQMVTGDGERFDAQIAPFTLAVPHALN